VVTELKEMQDILYQYHSNPMGGHSGINNTLSKISNFYMWNGMKEDVVEYVSIIKQIIFHPARFPLFLAGNIFNIFK
jgi:hypothetical protein